MLTENVFFDLDAQSSQDPPVDNVPPPQDSAAVAVAQVPAQVDPA